MKLGDRVHWESQSSGSWTRKEGEVVAIVPAGVKPDNCMPAGFKRNTIEYGLPRDEESYLIRVDGKGRRLYWPKVDNLVLDRDSHDERPEAD